MKKLLDTLRYYIIPLTTAIGVLGFTLGGSYVWLGFLTYPVLLLLDVLLPKDFKIRNAIAPLVDLSFYLHAFAMIALYTMFILSIRNGSNPLNGGWSSTGQILGSILSLTWLSAVPTLPVAHELMHRRHPFPRFVSKVLNTFYGDSNRDISHVMTHHIHLDTAKDSDTPLRGQTVYSFCLSATLGSYRDTVNMESEILRKMGRSPWNIRNKVWLHLVLQMLLFTVVFAFAGLSALLVCIVSVFFAKMLVEAFNYFQHYGLLRVENEPVEKHHAWNHLGMIVRPLGAEITNHINHHLDSYIRCYDLTPEPKAPQMPSLFLCFMTGLIPPVWFKFIAKPALKEWDNKYASPAEQKLAKEANAKAGWEQWILETPETFSVPAE